MSTAVPAPPPLPMTGLSAEDAALLAQHLVPRSLEAGEVLLRAGGAERVLVWVQSGAVEVRLDLNGQRFTVDHFGPGAIFGELGFFDPDHVRAADVVATAACEALILPFSAYAAMVSAGEPLVVAIEEQVLAQLGARMTATSQRLGELLARRDQPSAWQALRRFLGLGA
jgi:CRP-like cAMP-binding protein